MPRLPDQPSQAAGSESGPWESPRMSWGQRASARSGRALCREGKNIGKKRERGTKEKRENMGGGR